MLFNIEKTRKEKASDFIGNLIKHKFINQHSAYIEKHFPFNDKSERYKMFNARVKALYKKFVLDEKIEESDFVNTLDLLCFFDKRMDNESFNSLLLEYQMGLYNYLYEEGEEDDGN